MEGLERLETQVLKMNNQSVTVIFEYLKTRKDLYEKFNNEEKSIEEMYHYICGKARKMAKNNVAMIQYNLVYIWAVTYFVKSNEELGIKEKKVMPPSADEVIKKQANKKAEKEDTQKENKDNQMSIFQEVQK